MTNKFKTEEDLNNSIQTFVIGNWHTKVLSKEVVMTEEEKKDILWQLKKWPKSFNPNHSNWMKKEFEVPSSIIRIDYVVNKHGLVDIFEIEDRPAGFEINALVSEHTNNSFLLSLDRLSEYAKKPIGICISKGRMFNSDDFFWVQRLFEFNQNWDFRDTRIVLGEVPKNPEDSIWFVRSLRTENEYYDLSPYSISTIEYEGDKSYGIEMGLWRHVDKNLYGNSLDLSKESINWKEPFVLKPEAGCRCENVHMFHPKRPGGGFSTRSKIEQAIQNGDVKYIQPYYEPEHPDFLPDGYVMIRRCYLTFDIINKSYQVIGGQWEARPKCHKIHGAKDSICGPLIV